HVHAARIAITDIEDHEIAAVVILGDIIDGCRAAKAVHHAEADRIMIEHRTKYAAHGAFLGPHLDADRLLIPEIAAIGLRFTAGIIFWIVPCWDALKGARFVYDPSPRNVAPLARLFEQSIHALHFVRRHRRDQATSEQLVADTASSNRLCGL